MKYQPGVDNKLVDVQLIAMLHTLYMIMVTKDNLVWTNLIILRMKTPRLDFGTIFQNVEDGDHRDVVDFVIKDSYLFKVMHF